MMLLLLFRRCSQNGGNDPGAVELTNNHTNAMSCTARNAGRLDAHDAEASFIKAYDDLFHRERAQLPTGCMLV
jgi:hypothetical protein